MFDKKVKKDMAQNQDIRIYVYMNVGYIINISMCIYSEQKHVHT